MAFQDLKDLVILITGASSGLGRAIAVETAARGAKVVVINYASNRSEAETTARLVEKEGATAIIVQGDVAKDADCLRIVEAARPFGRIDALFNNAGATVFADQAQLDTVSAEDFLRLYSVNVVGAYQMIRAAQTLLEAAPFGVVVNTASVAGVTGLGSSIPYAASKGALVTMTLSLARSLAPKIRVNAICPGYIDTPWYGDALPQETVDALRLSIAESNPLKVASKAEEIAGAAIFFATPGGRHVTGETLLADAGLHLGQASLAQR